MAHNEGLFWIGQRTSQLRYSAGGVDRWLQPLSTYIAAEPIKRGQPVSVAILADFNELQLALGTDNQVVLTRPTRHHYSIGLALESAAAGGTIHVQEHGRFSYTAANSATEYWDTTDFTQYSNGAVVYCSPQAPGTFTLSSVTAVTGGSTLIQIGSISNTIVSGSNMVSLDIEVSITGDGRGPLDNTQFEVVLGEAITYTVGSYPPLCAMSDGSIPGIPAGTAILADNRYQNRSNTIGFLLNPPQAAPFAAGSNCLFLRKGLLSVSGVANNRISGSRYFLGQNGLITPSGGSVVYPAALVEVGIARDVNSLIVDISQPLLGVADYPLGTLKPLANAQPVDSGFLLCDGVNSHGIDEYAQFYAWATHYSPSTISLVPGNPTRFTVAANVNPADGSFYEISAYTPSYEPLSSIVNRLTGQGTISGTTVTLDLTPFTTSGVQSVGGLTMDQFLPTLYVAGNEVTAKGWTLAGNTLTGDISNLTGVSGQPYVLRVYRPEALARYQDATTILGAINLASQYAVNSSAVVNYLANTGPGSTGTLILGNNSASSVVKILGAIQLGDTGSLDNLVTQGPITVKSDAGATVVLIDNALGNVTVSSSQSYPTSAGHLVNKAYSDLHDINTKIAIGGAFVNGVFSNDLTPVNYSIGVHGIKMGVAGAFDADMIDERHVGGWGWTSDTQANATNNLPTARTNSSVPEITANGAVELGKVINLYLTTATKPPVYPAVNSVVSTAIQTLGANNAASYLQIVNPNSSIQAIQIGNPTNANAVNLISVGSNLLVTNDNPPANAPTNWAQVKALSFLSVSSVAAKKKIVPFVESGLEIIKGTEIFKYQFKSENRPRVGFIAEWTDPLLSGPDRNENDLGTTLGVALRAIQELADDNEMLKKEIAALKTAAIKANLL